ncbi:metallophosphoesterase [Nonomuraea terrae]|uniref:Metallophosphoesterase n=1 Tax=Nonomuraea terrae TaxID=2530383 RepID=A0A4R4YS59_9ACTN|nr:metallophosphoesterase [Nonomuraea terrae]TDD47039.1 metallophosphoesterase [Nonomuraea terrae]
MFVLIFLGGGLLAHAYLWWRLVRQTTGPGRLRRALTLCLVVLFAMLVATFVGARTGLEGWLVWAGYIWVAVMFYLAVILITLEIPRAVAAAFLRARSRRSPPVAVPALAGPGPERPEALTGTTPEQAEPITGPAPEQLAERDLPAVPDRRLFLARTVAFVAGAGALGTVGYGLSSALGDPVIERVQVTLPRLDPRLSGLRFAVVSDVHLGPLTGIGHTERIVRMINGLEADVVAIVGDLVDGSVARLGPLARPLRHLESRYGAFFVTGNHEYFAPEGPGEWIEELGELGVRSLRNERVEIRHQGAVLDLAGVNDVGGASVGDPPDFAKALGGRDPRRSSVLLAHQPIQVSEAARHGVDLQLSGHTHGGQLAPFNLVVGLQQPVVSGLARFGGTQVYVTRGAGFWGPPVRVGAPPEITMLELES